MPSILFALHIDTLSMSVDSLYLCTYNSEGSNVDLCAEPGTTLALRGNCQAEAPSSCCLRGRCCSEARKLVNETSPLIISPLYLKMYLLWLEEFGYDIYFSFCGCLCRIMAEYGIVIYIDVPSDILAKRIVSAGIQSRPLFPPRCTENLVRAFWTILIFFPAYAFHSSRAQIQIPRLKFTYSASISLTYDQNPYLTCRAMQCLIY